VGSVVSWYSDVCGSVHVHEGLSLSRGVVHRMVVKVKALMPDDEMMSVRRGMTTRVNSTLDQGLGSGREFGSWERHT